MNFNPTAFSAFRPALDWTANSMTRIDHDEGVVENGEYGGMFSAL